MPEVLDQPASTTANNGEAASQQAAPVEGSAPQSGGEVHPDRAAFDAAMKNAGRAEGQQQSPSPEKAADEVKPVEALKSDEQQPAFKAELTDKAKKYMTELAVTEDQAFDTAVSAYERYTSHTEEQLQKMFDDDPKAFVESGLKLAKIQKDSASFTAEHHRILEELKALKQGAQQPGQPPAEPIPLADDVKSSITQLIEAIPEGEFVDGDKFREVMGVGLTTVADKIAATAQANVKKMQEDYEAKTAAYEKRLSETTAQLVDLQISQARTRHMSQHPELAKPEVLERVLKHYDAFAASGQYESVDSAFEKAVNAELGPESATKTRDRLLRNHATRKAVAPRLPTPLANKHAVPMSPEDRDRLQYERSWDNARKKPA